MARILKIIVPCFNEEAALPKTAERLASELEVLIKTHNLDAGSQICFVDDGSTDSTWNKILDLSESSNLFAGLKLSRNFGHQRALFAGLMECEADITVSIDADLQDDVSVLDQMLTEHENGSQIVLGVRDDRSHDSWFKRATASLHYKLLTIIGVESIADHADFRLMSRLAVRYLSQYRETQLYLRGLIPLLGLPTAQVHYSRHERVAGETKYSFTKMLNLSIDGILSFSSAPLRAISVVGISVFLISIFLTMWVLASVFSGSVVPGWASTVLPIYLLGGFQLFALGVVGEYVAKIYLEAKARPIFHVEDRCGNLEGQEPIQ
jgi:glycosyltransferase involved in cell wall biosynthesis